MARSNTKALLILVGLALVASACANGDEDAGRSEWIVGLALARIPDGAEPFGEVMVVDLPSAAAAAGMAVPGSEAPDDMIADYFLGMPRDALLPDLLRDPAPEFGDLTVDLGIDPSRVSLAITAGTPPETYQVLEGDFDAAAIDAAVRSDPIWSGLLRTAEHRGVTYYAWGGDFETDLTRVTTVRPLGRGGRLALDAGFLYWAPWTAGIEGLIDAGAGAVPTLADDSRLARAARALAAAGVYSAILTDRPLVEDAAVSGLVLGIGGGRDEAGAYWVIVAVHDTTAAAQESATAVRSVLSEGTILSTGQLWSERVTGLDIEVEDDMLVVVVRSAGREGDWLQAYYRRELLLVAAQG